MLPCDVSLLGSRFANDHLLLVVVGTARMDVHTKDPSPVSVLRHVQKGQMEARSTALSHKLHSRKKDAVGCLEGRHRKCILASLARTSPRSHPSNCIFRRVRGGRMWQCCLRHALCINFSMMINKRATHRPGIASAYREDALWGAKEYRRLRPKPRNWWSIKSADSPCKMYAPSLLTKRSTIAARLECQLRSLK